MRTTAIFLILFTTVSTTTQSQTTKTWDGGANTINWTDGNNWNPNGAPGTSDVVSFNTSRTITVNSSIQIGKLQITNNSTLTLNSSGDDRTITVSTASSDAISVSSGSTLILAGTRSGQSDDMTLTTADNSSLFANISGTVRVNGTFGRGIFTKGANAKINFNANSTYDHHVNGGTIPTATWDSISLCLITGITTSDPGGLDGQIFGNLTYNSIGQTDDENINQSFIVKNDFKILSTGTLPNLGSLRLAVNNSDPETITTKNFEMASGEFFLSDNPAIGTVNVSGNFTHSGGLITEGDVGSGSILFTGNTTNTPQIFTSGGSVTGTINYTVNSGAILQMAAESTVVNGASFTLLSGGTLDIKSANGITNSVTGTGVTAGNIRTITRTFNTGANYIYSGTAAQNTGNGLPSTVTGSLKIENAAGVSLSQATNISTGILYLASGVLSNTTNVLTMGTNTSTVNGRISRSGGTLSAVPSGTNLYIVEYTGNDINTGNEFNAYSKNVILNLNSGKTVTMTKDFSTAGVLTFTNGYLNPSTFALNILSGGSVTGANHGSFVNGKISKTGTTAFTFPVGGYDVTHGYRYHPIEISAPTSNTTFSAQYFRSNPLSAYNVPYTGVLTDLYKNEYWDLTRTAGTSSVDVTLFWNEYSGAVQNQYISNTALESVAVAHYKLTSGSTYNWHKEGVANIAHAISNTVVSGSYAVSGSVKVTGVSTFSPLAIGSNNAALPVLLSSFTAKPSSNNTVALNWATSSEIVNKGFRIERQSGGINGKFESLGFVASKANGGNSQTSLYYNFIDANPRSGATSYYRLAQEDLDSKTNFSEIRVVKLNGETVSTVFPNPSTGAVNISRTANGKKMNVQVIDMSGRMVQQFTNVTDSNFKFNISKSGVYNIKMTYTETGEQYVQKIVVEK